MSNSIARFIVVDTLNYTARTTEDNKKVLERQQQVKGHTF